MPQALRSGKRGDRGRQAADLLPILAHELIANLHPRLRAPLDILVAKGGLEIARHEPSLIAELRRRLPALLVTDSAASRLELADPSLRPVLATALASARATAEPAASSVVRQIAELIARGEDDAALARFAEEGGPFFAHLHGVFAAEDAVAAFPDQLRHTDEMLVLAAAINAMKAGNYTAADHLVDLYFGPGAAELPALRAAGDSTSPAFGVFSFIRTVYADRQLDAAEIRQLFRLLGRLAAEAHLERGLLLNVALDAFVRQRAWAMAEQTARQALTHFQTAGAPQSSFYILLYLAVISLGRGELQRARTALDEAGAELRRVVPPAPNDRRILKALCLVCDYEQGQHQGLVDFALAVDEGTLFGEIWPSVAEPIISRATLALSVHLGLGAARAYLDRWRVLGFHSDRTYRLLALEEIALLQRHRRVMEAEDRLGAALAQTPVRLDGSIDADLPRPPAEQIELKLAQIRALLDRHADAGLAVTTLGQLLERPELTIRQRAEALLLLALGTTDGATRRAALLEYFDIVDDRRLGALDSENRDRLAALRRDRRRLGDFAASPKLQRRLRVGTVAERPQAVLPQPGGLTEQEARILLLLAELTPNKLIATRLGVSTPTVRFHLKNLYRKLGCNSRRQAVAIAASRGLISA
jgi:DNA-binding CsgD family transcriptional regulator